MLRLSLLGTPQIAGIKGVVNFSRRQPLGILTVLALAKRDVSRDRLAFLPWSDCEQSLARQRLRRVLSQLRASLAEAGESEVLLTTPGTVSLDRTRCEVDIWEFEQLARQGSALDGRAAIVPAQQAAALYRGPLLDDLSFSEAPELECWLASQRDYYARLYEETLSTLVRGFMSITKPDLAIETAERLLAVNPLREEAHCLLMRLYANSGQRHAALKQYQRCRQVLAEELDVDPLPETRALYEALLADHPLISVCSKPAGWNVHPSLTAPLVGRSAELEQLQIALQSGLSAHPAVACVSGPAGIGKTRLIREAVENLPAAIWIGTGRGTNQVIPYRLVLDALQVGLAEMSSQTSGNPLNLSEIWVSEASRLIPDLHLFYPHLPSPPPLPPDQAQTRLLEALTRLSSALAQASHGAVLVLDDLHYGDAASFAWLNMLVTRLSSVALGIVVAYQEEKSNPWLSEWLDLLTRLGIRRNISLGEFSIHTINSLLSQTGFSPDLAIPLMDKTGGNPFFVLETLRAMQAGDLAQPWPVPDTVQEVIRARLEPLDAATRQVLDACVVLSSPLQAELVQAVSGRDEVETADGLDALVARHFLLEREGNFTFAHSQITDTLYKEIGKARRLLLHRRTAAALSSRQPRIHALIAHHLEQAGLDGEAAAAWLEAAQQARALTAMEDTLLACARGLALTQDPALRFSFLAMCIDAHHLKGEREAEGAELAALQVLVENFMEAPQQAEAWLRESRYAEATSHYEEALAAAQTAISLSQTYDGTWVQVESRLLCGKMLQNRGEFKAAQTHYGQALVMAKTARLHQLEAYALRECGLMFWHQGDYARATDYGEQSLHICQTIHDRHGIELALNMLGSVLGEAGDYPGASQYFGEALKLCQQIGDRRYEAKLLTNLGLCALHQHDLTATIQSLQEGLRISREVSDRFQESRILNHLALCSQDLGEYDQARAFCEEALQMSRRIGDRPGEIWWLISLGSLSRYMGDYEASSGYVQRAIDMAEKFIQVHEINALLYLGHAYTGWCV